MRLFALAVSLTAAFVAGALAVMLLPAGEWGKPEDEMERPFLG